jgi:hypothetical protein
MAWLFTMSATQRAHRFAGVRRCAGEREEYRLARRYRYAGAGECPTNSLLHHAARIPGYALAGENIIDAIRQVMTRDWYKVMLNSDRCFL